MKICKCDLKLQIFIKDVYLHTVLSIGILHQTIIICARFYIPFTFLIGNNRKINIAPQQPQKKQEAEGVDLRGTIGWLRCTTTPEIRGKTKQATPPRFPVGSSAVQLLIPSCKNRNSDEIHVQVFQKNLY